MQREPHPPSLGHDPQEEPLADREEAAKFVTRFGTVVGGGVIAAAASSLPAELRMGDGGSIVRAIEQWLALAALLTPLAILVVAVLRRGRAGLRILAGDRGPLFAAAALWWAVLELGILSVFGAVLRAKTHHHGLAGVTFAILALVSGLVVAMLAVRGVRMLLRMPPGGHRVALIVAASAAFIVISLIGIRTSRAAGLHTAAALVDTLALVVSSAIASTRAMARWRPLAVGGVPIAVAILLLGYACVRAEPDLKELLAEGAPVQAWVLGFF
jgi:FtsH-binding integral membrane protein